MKVTILGCGSSGGVPLITGNWGACNPENPYNKRRRVGLCIEVQGKTLLIDTSPDLRQQLIDAQVKSVDAVIYTHGHADHIYGLHELRYYKQKDSIPVFGDQKTIDILVKAFDYAFASNHDFYRPFVRSHVHEETSFQVLGVEIIPFPQYHVTITSWGYRIGNFAYSTDFKSIPESSLAMLEGLDTWVVDCLSFDPHPTHSDFQATCELIKRVKPKKAVLTHMNHSMDYDVVLDLCEDGIVPAYDGMVLEI